MTPATPPAPGPARRPRVATTTARFGSGRRESHDATLFYERFTAPEISDDEAVAAAGTVDVIHRHDARDMAAVPDASVALVVTSPPYFAGKQYEASLGENGVPATYFEYLALLHDVFAECKRVLEPGGRIAVNVANLGRRPYRSLAGDVTQILSDLGLLLRGEVVWWKGRAAGGSCAWGTFQQPRNPVLRDVTERIVIASKGRFDRALTPQQRAKAVPPLPSNATITRDEFLEATTDLWELAPESATRVGHPAPFPVQLPLRLIELYTYAGDVVLDPFMGSGSTAVAAVQTGRHYIGFDTDDDYITAAEARIATARAELTTAASTGGGADRAAVDDDDTPAAGGATEPPEADAVAAAVRRGLLAKDVARIVIETAGFTGVKPGVKLTPLGIELGYTAIDAHGHTWAFDVSGGFTTTRSGLRRTDTLWRSLGQAAVLHGSPHALPLILLSTELPAKGTGALAALRAVCGPGRPVVDAIAFPDDAGLERLQAYASDGPPAT